MISILTLLTRITSPSNDLSTNMISSFYDFDNAFLTNIMKQTLFKYS